MCSLTLATAQRDEEKFYFLGTNHRSETHLVRGPVQLAAAATRLFVVLADVHHLPLAALPDQVTPHTRDIFKAVT